MRLTERLVYIVMRSVFRSGETGIIFKKRWDIFVKPLIRLDSWWKNSLLFAILNQRSPTGIVKWHRQHEREFVLKEIYALIEEIKSSKLNS